MDELEITFIFVFHRSSPSLVARQGRGGAGEMCCVFSSAPAGRGSGRKARESEMLSLKCPIGAANSIAFKGPL